MAKKKDEDDFTPFEPLLQEADTNKSPWKNGAYVPDLDLLAELLSKPISAGDKQESGRPAKAFDAWIAHELRRAGFPPDAVWPRVRRPRVLPDDLAPVEAGLDHLQQELRRIEQESGKRVKPRELRQAIRALDGKLPGAPSAYILGDFYSKQIDVAISSWRRGPDLLVSTKTMFSSYRKNLKNRHEEAVGEVKSLRARHPMAAMGYAYLVRRTIYDEEGAYAILFDILARLRRKGEAFDATMLLVADWDDEAEEPKVTHIDQPAPELDARTFFQDLIGAVLDRSPITEHVEVRRRRDGTPPGGLPDEAEDEELE
ncbi:hypothetical protein JDY09_00660 [Thermoleophilum album]|jgi:CRISPR/Cas system CSM-associated protein Csm2 small subunit|uniref:hypothetical protein n=1 Tax=Thermoleophilum album TaxID=29539 RepID=UPI00237C7D91|nr:hypothetical protein [Thermoleophilum album]WDT93808.1 hypothetical protein JDY09_00660 [Thermoleophilum album]